nr:MAG TPA: hypothetical protein [Caudoviricetes sp.]
MQIYIICIQSLEIDCKIFAICLVLNQMLLALGNFLEAHSKAHSFDFKNDLIVKFFDNQNNITY